jgi:chromosomal replication initiator protein
MKLSVPSRYVKHWIETHYQQELNAAAQAVSSEVTLVELQVAESTAANRPHAIADVLERVVPGANRPDARPSPRDSATTALPFSLDQFIVGSSNRVAHAACTAIVDKPAMLYNPLVLCGGHGLGKTHLLHALARAIQQRHPEMTVKLVSAEHFANTYLAALRDRKLDAFRLEYRRCNVLLVDDVQFLAGKEKTQDEFLFTFDALHQLGRQIVLTCDAPPREIKRLDERLRERFQSGLVANLDAPDFDTRVALVQAKAKARGLTLETPAAELLAYRIEKSVRELEGAVCKLAALVAAEQRAPNHETALLALCELGYVREGPLTCEEIVATTSKRFNLTPDEIRSDRRHASLVRARHISIFLAKQLTRLSLSEIGQFFGNRDHSTVLHAIRKVEQETRQSAELREELLVLRRALGR